MHNLMHVVTSIDRIQRGRSIANQTRKLFVQVLVVSKVQNQSAIHLSSCMHGYIDISWYVPSFILTWLGPNKARSALVM